MGLGLFGGGVGVSRYLVNKGAKVIITDLRNESELKKSLDKLSGLSAVYHLGGHHEEDFSNADYIIANPAVPPDSPFLEIARRHGIPVLTEMSLFMSLCPSPVIGITGSLGKSTTLAMLDSMFRCSGLRYFMGGNIGISLFDHLEEMDTNSTVLLELSSFQLNYFHGIRKSPNIAVLTNIYHHHLDYHKTYEKYIEAKRAVFQYQGPEDMAILGQGSSLRELYGSCGQGRKVFLGSEKGPFSVFWDGTSIVLKQHDDILMKISGESLKVPGMHNIQNAMAAIAAAHGAGLDEKSIPEGLVNFKGMPHRLELAGKNNKVTWVNDSKSTTPQSVLSALNSLKGPIILILGGYDKGSSFDDLFKSFGNAVRFLIFMGAAAERLSHEASILCPDIPQLLSKNLYEAVNRAAESAEPGETILFSPGCSSYDEFNNYEERGSAFKSFVREIS